MKIWTFLLAVVVLAGCQTTQNELVMLERTGDDATILVMPTDIELMEITAGGVVEPRADWTTAAEGHFNAALYQHLTDNGKNYRIVKDRSELGMDPETAEQLFKLHDVVSSSVALHNHPAITQFHLPSKKGAFDWTMGSEVTKLRDQYDADYALFLYLRDSYASGGRKAAIFVAAVLFGAHMQGGSQSGIATLVDLNTGDVVWYHRLYRQAGDLRTPEQAPETVALMLTDFPQ